MAIRAFFRVVQIGVVLLAAQGALAANAVRTVSLEAPAADAARLQLQLSAAPRQNVFALDNPHRIVIDLAGTELARGVRLPAAAGPVRAVRSGRSGGTLRLVLELNRDLDPKVTVNGTLLTIELGSLPAVSGPPQPVRTAHAPTDVGRDIVIAVDAGHGGQDPGATGATGTREKDVVLAIARELARRINAEPGMRAYLTRDADRFIPLRDRIALARRAHADMFVSIHADAIKDRAVTGSSVYVLSDRGAASEANRMLADQENAADLKGGISLSDVDDSVASVLMDVLQNQSISHSMDAAGRVLGELDHVGTIRKTQIQQAAFVVLKSPDIPSMLVETAYISNPGEERKLRTREHQAEIAEAIFKGVREYFGEIPPDGTLFAQQRSGGAAAATIIAGSTGP